MKQVLIVLCLFFLSISAITADSTTETLSAEDFKKSLDTFDKTTLTKYALAAERYMKIKSGKEHTYGGLHDYIRNLTEEQIKNVILGFTEKYPELYKNNLLDSLSNQSVLSLSEIKTKLEAKELTTLYAIALSCENYEREKEHDHRLGGLHDYIYSLDKAATVNIILSFVKHNPELTIENKLESLSETAELVKSALVLGGIEDYIRNFSRAELAKMALASESYDEEKKGKKLGGLHDYIDSLNESEIMEKIFQYIKEYPELKVAGKLESLAGIQKYGFVFQLNNIKAPVSDAKLRDYCLAIDAINSKEKGTIGGIHDYVYKLNRVELIKYLKRMATEYPQVIQEGGLEELLAKATTLSESTSDSSASLKFLN